eukprot:3187860-Ditylum_brightwellii.AAC.1
MKIDVKSFEFANLLVGNRPPPILFYMSENPKDEKLAVYLLTVKYYKVGTPEECLQFVDAIAQ